MLLKTQAATEVARFLAYHPTPEQIIALHPSPEVAARAYEFIRRDRDGSLTEEERKELESYALIEYLIELVKLEAHPQLRHLSRPLIQCRSRARSEQVVPCSVVGR